MYFYDDHYGSWTTGSIICDVLIMYTLCIHFTTTHDPHAQNIHHNIVYNHDNNISLLSLFALGTFNQHRIIIIIIIIHDTPIFTVLLWCYSKNGILYVPYPYIVQYIPNHHCHRSTAMHRKKVELFTEGSWFDSQEIQYICWFLLSNTVWARKGIYLMP